jgi:hypothetical protein
VDFVGINEDEGSDLLSLNDDQLHTLQQEPHIEAHNENYQKQKEVFYEEEMQIPLLERA